MTRTRVSTATKTAAPRVAIVIPCFNDGATVEAAVASAHAVTGSEVVVVDDGSTDPATNETLDRLAARGVRVIRQQHGGSPASARMNGVRSSSAPYVLPLDADDTAIADGVGRLVAALDERPDASAAWGDVQFVGRITRLQRSARAIDPWLLTHLNSLPGPALYRRSALLEVGGWPVDLGYEDWDLWLSFAERGFTGVYVRGAVVRASVARGRRWSGDVAQDEAIRAELRDRHPTLFAARRPNWRRSKAAWRLRVSLPLIDAMPGVSARTKVRLRGAVAYPGLVVSRLRRRAADHASDESDGRPRQARIEEPQRDHVDADAGGE